MSPIDTPPLVITASHVAAPAVMASVMAASSSRMRPRSTACQPFWATSASSVARFESRICPGASGRPASTSSSPVDSTPTRGRGWASTSVTPIPASTPRWPGVITSPGENTGSPTRRSSPATRTASPADTSAPSATRAPSSRRVVCSTITTASAPSGIGAPVKMRMASPGCSARSAGWPAATSATTGSTTGDASLAPDVSAARTA